MITNSLFDFPFLDLYSRPFVSIRGLSAFICG
jgi:hypothetical protein